MNQAQQPPEAHLIERARKNAIPALSVRAAAKTAGISEARWRQLERGFSRSKGIDTPEVAPAETLARMAKAVDVTESDLKTAGRGDAAKVLAHLAQHGVRKRPPVEEVPSEDLLDQIAEITQELRRRMSESDSPAGRPPLHLVARQIDDGDESTFERGD